MWPLSVLLSLISKVDLGAILPSFVGFIPALVQSIKEHWKIYLIILLAGLEAITAYEWKHARQDFNNEKAAHAADILKYKQAQQIAEDAVKTVRTKLKKESQEKADAADRNYHDL